MVAVQVLCHPVSGKTLRSAIDGFLTAGGQRAYLSTKSVWDFGKHLSIILNLKQNSAVAVVDAGISGIHRAVAMVFEGNFKDYYVMLDPKDVFVGSALIENVKRIMREYKASAGGLRGDLKASFTKLKKRVHLVPVVISSSSPDCNADSFVKGASHVIRDNSITRDVVLIWPNARNLERYVERVRDLHETLMESGDIAKRNFGETSNNIARILALNVKAINNNEDCSLIPALPSESLNSQVLGDVDFNIGATTCNDVDDKGIDMTRVKFVVTLVPVGETCADELIISQNRRMTLGNRWYESFALGASLKWDVATSGPVMEDEDGNELAQKKDFIFTPYRVFVNVGGSECREYVSLGTGSSTVISPGQPVSPATYKELAVPAVYNVSSENHVFRYIDLSTEDKFLGIFSNEYYAALTEFLHDITKSRARKLLWINDGPSLWSQYLSMNQDRKSHGEKYMGTLVSVGSRYSEAVARMVVDNCAQFPNAFYVDVAQPSALLTLGSCVKYNPYLSELISKVVRLSSNVTYADFDGIMKECENILIHAAKPLTTSKRKQALRTLSDFPVVVINNFDDPFKLEVPAAAMLLAMQKFASDGPVIVAFLVDPFFATENSTEWARVSWLRDEDKALISKWTRIGAGTPVDARMAFTANPLSYDARGHYSEYPPVFFSVYGLNLPDDIRQIAETSERVQVQTDLTPAVRIPYSLSRGDGSDIVIVEPLIHSMAESAVAVPSAVFNHDTTSSELISVPPHDAYKYLESLVATRTERLISAMNKTSPSVSMESIAAVRRDSAKDLEAIRNIASGEDSGTSYGPLVVDVSDETTARLSIDCENVRSLLDIVPSSAKDDADRVGARDMVMATFRDFLKVVHSRMVAMKNAITRHVYRSDVEYVVKGELYRAAYKNFTHVLSQLEARLAAADVSYTKVMSKTIDQSLRAQYQPVIASLFNVLQTELRIIDEIKQGDDVDYDLYLQSIREFSYEFLREVRCFSQSNVRMVGRAHETIDSLVTFLNSSVFESVREMENFYETLNYDRQLVIDTSGLMDMYLHHGMNDLIQKSMHGVKLYVSMASVYMRQLCSSYELLARRKANDTVVASNKRVLENAPEFAKHIASIRLGSFLDAHVESLLHRAVVAERAAHIETPGSPARRIIRSIDWDAVKNSPMSMDKNRDEIAQFLHVYGSFSTRDAVESKKTFEQFLVCPNPSGPIQIKELAFSLDDEEASQSEDDDSSDEDATDYNTGSVIEGSSTYFKMLDKKNYMPDDVFNFVGSLLSKACLVNGNLVLHLPSNRPNLSKWLKDPYPTSSTGESAIHMAFRHLEDGRQLPVAKRVSHVADGRRFRVKHAPTHALMEEKFRQFMTRRHGSDYTNSLLAYSDYSVGLYQLSKVASIVNKTSDLAKLSDEIIVASIIECTDNMDTTPNSKPFMDLWHRMLKKLPAWWYHQDMMSLVPEVADPDMLKLLDRFKKEKPSSITGYYGSNGLLLLVEHFRKEVLYHAEADNIGYEIVDQYLRSYCHDINRKTRVVAMHYMLTRIAFSLVDVLMLGQTGSEPGSKSDDPLNAALYRAAMAASTVIGEIDPSRKYSEEALRVEQATVEAIHRTAPGATLGGLTRYLSDIIRKNIKHLQSSMARKVSCAARGVLDRVKDGRVAYEDTNVDGYTFMFMIAACNLVTWAMNRGVHLAYYDVESSRRKTHKDVVLLKLLQSLVGHFVATMQSYDVPELLCMWTDIRPRELWMSTSEFFGHRLAKEDGPDPASAKIIPMQAKRSEFERTPATLVELASIDPSKLLEYHISHNDEHHVTALFIDDFNGKQLSETQYQNLLAVRKTLLPDEIDGGLQEEADAMDPDVYVVAELGSEFSVDDDDIITDDEDGQALVPVDSPSELVGESVFTNTVVSISETPESDQSHSTVPEGAQKKVAKKKRERSPTEYMEVPGKQAEAPYRSLPFIYNTPIASEVVVVQADTDEPDITVCNAIAEVDPSFVAPPLSRFGVTDISSMCKRLSVGISPTAVVNDIQHALEQDNSALDQWVVNSHRQLDVGEPEILQIETSSDVNVRLVKSVKRRIVPTQVLSVSGRSITYSPAPPIRVSRTETSSVQSPSEYEAL